MKAYLNQLFHTDIDYYLDMLYKAAAVALLVTAVYALVRLLRLKKRGAFWDAGETRQTLLVCYLAGLLALTMVPNSLWGGLWQLVRYGWPLEPMRLFTLTFRFSSLPTHLSIQELLNVALYVPFGLLYPWARRQSVPRTLVAGVVLSLAVELVQPFVGRSFDLSDLLLNFIGTLLGAAVYTLIRWAWQTCSRK